MSIVDVELGVLYWRGILKMHYRGSCHRPKGDFERSPRHYFGVMEYIYFILLEDSRVGVLVCDSHGVDVPTP